MGILAVKRVLIKFKFRVLFGRIQRKVVISCHVGIEESIALASNLVPFYSIKPDEEGTWDLSQKEGDRNFANV